MTYGDERRQGDVVGDLSDQDSQKAEDAGISRLSPGFSSLYIYKAHIFFCGFHLHMENIAVHKRENK